MLARPEREPVRRRRWLPVKRQIGCSLTPLPPPPAQCDSAIVETLVESANAHKISHQRMISRAYHDSLFLSRVAPTAMLFIPCRGGVSHRPDEFSSPEAIAKGTLVLAETLARLAG